MRGLKIVSLRAYRFDSGQGHHPNFESNTLTGSNLELKFSSGAN